MNTNQTAVWLGHSKQWDLVASPLRPSPEDSDLALGLASETLLQSSVPKNVAVLGVTPELVHLDWPLDTTLFAFDQSADMLQRVWNPNESIKSSATLARWQDLPMPDRFFDLVVGDGSLNTLHSFNEYGHVFEELARVTRPNAALVIRFFVRPDVPESMEFLQSSVANGLVKSFHALKLRLQMLLAEKHGGALAMSHVFNAFDSHFNSGELSSMTGWPKEVIDTINVFQDAATVYNYPKLLEIHDLCQPHWRVDTVACGQYELAECCLTVRFLRTLSV